MANKKFYIKENDLLPPITGIVLDDGEPFPLNDVTSVKFLMRDYRGVKVNGTGTVDQDPATGQVWYYWSGSDTSEPGTYEGEFELTFSNGKTQTFPASGYLKIKVGDDVA